MSHATLTASLIAPYGGRLIDLFAAPEERAELLVGAREMPSLQLRPRQVCDLELLATGGFSPLECFMGEADYRRVLADMRLADDTLFPIPVTLTTGDPKPFPLGGEIALRSPKNELLAVLALDEVYAWDKREEASLVCGTTDVAHPLVAEMESWGGWCLAGRLRVVDLPPHTDFAELRRTPAQVRELLAERGLSRVVAFQTRNPLHRAHEELTKRAADEVDGGLLIHPVVGLTKPGDVDHYTRVRSYKALVERYYDPNRTVLSLLPLAMRLAGPREAVWHAIVRRNHGATHFIVGRDHAGPGKDSQGKPFYGPYDAQELLASVADEVGVGMVPFQQITYLPDEDRFEPADQVPAGARTLDLSGTQVRDDYLNAGRLLPPWFTRPEVARILAHAYPPRQRQGFCLWFTGLPSSGKSTVADLLVPRLLEFGRQVTVLDGDVVRTHLSKGLGFSKDDRDVNILRIGFVASEIVRHNGVVVCAAVSPYRATRNQVRSMHPGDHFVEIFVDTPVEVCEQRDAKGLYAQARAGRITGFTGVDDPYEPPASAEIVLDTVGLSPEENVGRIIDYLVERRFLSANGWMDDDEG
ncbi:MAG: bifunctional sulfate adenylyltransferase/adenylylsulfate kinase [Armatimonadetes bacterium]|nr:bifunctional sulfate adenylyltransferase/adenylylsulfate kinase [Armatimonadota bacterium]